MANRQMQKLFILTIAKAFGGRGSTRKWVNNYPYEAAAEIDDPIHHQIANQIVTAERGIHLNAVSFLSYRVNRRAHTPTESGINGAFISAWLGGYGSRAASGLLLPQEACLRLFRVAQTGRQGMMSYRGCLSFDDVDRSAVGEFTIKRDGQGNIPAWITAFRTAVTSPLPGGAEQVLPDNSLDFLDYSRTVIAYSGAEVGFRQTRNRRVSPDQALYEGARSEVKDIERRVGHLIKGAPAAFTDPAYLPTLRALGSRVKEIMEALPPEKRVNLALEEASRKVLALNVAT